MTKQNDTKPYQSSLKEQMKTKRIIIYPKDVQRITGKSARYGRTLLNKIRESKLKLKINSLVLMSLQILPAYPLKKLHPTSRISA